MENKGDGDTNYNWCTWNDSQRLSKRVKGVRNQRMSVHHPKCTIVDVGWNTEKHLGDLRRLTVLQTSVKDHRITLVSKYCFK